jgi:hypothetical protein
MPFIAGVVGHVKWHYYTAAAINGYTVSRSRDGKTWSLVATVVLSDAFKMAQRPLTFVAKHAKGEWRWPIESLAVDPNHRLTAQLGPPEK